jgi:hypothetical protein
MTLLRSMALVAALTIVARGAEKAPAKDDAGPLPDHVDFDRDIKPVFAKRCYSCHGAEQAEASLRLDRKTEAMRGGNNGPILVAGKSAESRLIAYVTGKNDDDTIMPPEGEPLSTTEIAMIRTWIDQGAAWPEEATEKRTSDHWSFKPIVARNPPTVAEGTVRNGIDNFILAELAKKRIKPSREADRATLIRRLSLDLLGLPPAPADVEEFVNDTSPDAYEKLVDRLLASPNYGERWARHWLDLARYADSDGYEKDTGRPFAWRYRQWVIDALNADMPFDQFTVEQLAGDLLPNATAEQKVATGFHRNTLTNKEGGVDQEEFRVAATVDRVNTTGSVWLGLTVGCAQCHTHKYDPILQREYYGLFAFFNSVQETDIAAPLASQLEKYKSDLASYEAERAKLAANLDEQTKKAAKRLTKWEESLDTDTPTEWTVVKPQMMRSNAVNKGKLTQGEDGVIVAEGDFGDTETYTLTIAAGMKPIAALRLEVLADDSLPRRGPGMSKGGNFVLSEFQVKTIPAAKNAKAKETPVAATIRFADADFSQSNYNVNGSFDNDNLTGWAVSGGAGRDHTAVYELVRPLTLKDNEKLVIALTQMYGGKHLIGRFRVSITDASGPVGDDKLPEGVAATLRKPAAERTKAESEKILAYFRKIDPTLAKLDRELADFAKKAPQDPATTVKAQTLAELPKPRETHVLVRGDFLRPGATVDAHTLEVLPPLKARGERPDRLDLAMWIVDKANPLTARVTVNRVWAQMFGRGLVPSVADFGTQGDKPSHPELLDWLAHEFQQTWSLKQLQRLIVTSATYRQSSKYRRDLHERDPLNVLLARQRRMRVEAEVVRDLALATSGLMDTRIGGESVRPRQPADIAALTYASGSKWVDSKGADLYRRGLYTWFQRTSPYPMLMTFDAPDSNVTCTRRERSNTPLQALTLLNDPVFFECAQAMGRRIVAEAPKKREARLRYALQLCVARRPNPDELETLGELFDEQLALMQADEAAAKDVVGPAGKEIEGTTTAELAAWTMVSRTLMNLDEFITRE